MDNNFWDDVQPLDVVADLVDVDKVRLAALRLALDAPAEHRAWCEEQISAGRIGLHLDDDHVLAICVAGHTPDGEPAVACLGGILAGWVAVMPDA